MSGLFFRRVLAVAAAFTMVATAVGTAVATAQIDTAGLALRARGDTGEELMQVRLGNTVVADFSVSTEWQEFEFMLDETASFDDLSVGFVNNEHDPIDRNAHVDWVELNGERREVEASGVWSTGNWTSETGCTSAPATDQRILCAGFLHFGGQPDASTIVVYAVGSAGTENLELQIDGTSVATSRVTSQGNVWASNTPTTAAVFTLPEPVEHHRLRVAFTNNGTFDGVDRNVLIDRVDIDGTVYETNEPSVESLGTWRNGAECGQGFFENRVLACDGWFQIPGGAVNEPLDDTARDLPVISAPDLRVEIVADDVTNVWGMDFLPTGELLFAERLGRISLLTSDGVVPVVTGIPNLGQTTSGLLGLAVDPNFTSNRRFYTCQGQESPKRQLIVAWELSADYSEANKVQTLVDIERTASHSGCGLDFDGGYLMVTMGDDVVASAPQDPTALHGKVLRIDPTTGEGHPENGSPHLDLDDRIFTLGHRNPQGVAFHPDTGAMWISEHGPDIEDEINELVAGGNYGWDPVGPQGPSVYDEDGRTMTDLRLSGAVSAEWNSGPSTVAPGDIEFLTGEQWGEFDGALAMTTLKDQRLHLFRFNDEGTIVARAVPTELDNGRFGRLRTAILGPDGALYVSTSNSGFQNVDLRNDEILRISPAGSPLFDSPFGDGTGDEPEATIDVAFRARGTTGDERVELLVGGDRVATFELTTTMATYVHEHDGVLGVDVRLRFVNDRSGVGFDRNVWVDYLRVDGETYQTESPGVFSTGTYTSATGCADGNKQSEWLHCNGYFQYEIAGDGAQGNAPPDGGEPEATIDVAFRARGTTGDERVELLVGGDRVATFELTTTMATYVHEHDGVLGVDVRLRFVNDRSGVGFDRNVWVDYLRVDGETYQTESPGVFSTGTYTSATGCADGNKQSEWLHCNGYFQYEIAGGG